VSFADAPWWEVFQDRILKGLIKEALRNNYDAAYCKTTLEVMSKTSRAVACRALTRVSSPCPCRIYAPSTM